METKLQPEFPSSPPNDESDGEEHGSVEDQLEDSPNGQLDDDPDDQPIDRNPTNNNVNDILKRLQLTGALLKKPKQEYYCYTCEKEFSDWEELETHLITHVSLPSVVIDKLPSDDEDAPPSGDEDWSEEEEEAPTPQKIEISQLLKKTGLSLKKPAEAPESSNSTLDKLSGLGFTIKKSTTPIKKEPELDKNKTSDVMQKLGKLGGLKLKIKCEGSNLNSFKVVNGLKDFKAESDEEEDKSSDENEKSAENQDAEFDEEQDKSGDQEQEESEAENDSEEEKKPATNNKIVNEKIANVLKNLQGKTVAKIEAKSPVKPAAILKIPTKDVQPAKLVGRPNMKQTPKRGANLPLPPKEGPKITEISTPNSNSPSSTAERRQSQNRNVESVTVKKELETVESQTASNAPLFSGQIKTERSSPPIEDRATPIIATVKTESEPAAAQNAQPLFSSQTSRPPEPEPVVKTEDTGVTIIEINGDSNDEDDDCCVVSATPATDVKPVIPKAEPDNTIEQVNYPSPSYPAASAASSPSWVAVSPSSYPITSTYGNSLPRSSSLQKNHSFNWNAPESKPPIDMLEKSAEDIFESLLSNTPKKEGFSMSDSEYISLDTLGPQHTCEICNTRFTSISLLDDHRRMTGHSKSLVTPTSSTLLPYNPTGASTILQSLLPVKQMVEQVGKMSGMGGPGFTHQQNVMINIQAYPGAGGVVPQQGAYNAYGQQQNMPPGYPQTPNNMYGQQQMPGQYPNQPYGAGMAGQQGYGQFQNSMPKPGYPPNSFDSSPFSATSPLQSMQQSVYGQPPTSMSSQLGQMGPPAAPHSNQYLPTSGSNMMKPPMTTSSGVRIQNIQTFSPGQMLGMQGHSGSDPSGAQPLAPGQLVGGQMPSPGQIRMAAGANVTGPRPRMPNVRGQRPIIRPGIQVHGQIRGNKPGVRMPMKRPGIAGAPGAPMKKRPNILLPGKHDNEDCQVMALQKQRDGMPMIQSVQGAKDKLNLGSQISITKKVVNKEANAMANILATRGISVKQKQKSRSPSPERPVPHIPNLGAGVSIKHTSKSSSFSIPEAKVGGGMLSCKVCSKMFMNQNSLSAHMSAAHNTNKLPMFRCEECPAAYPKILQLQHHKRVFHNVVGPNRELGLPVVDMSQEDNLKRLSSLGIYSFIPLADKDGGAGCFGLPIISVHNAQNGMTKNLQALGAEGLLSLGPIKQLPNT